MALHKKGKLQPLLDFATTGKAFCYIHQTELRPREDDNDFFAATVAGFCYYRWRFLLHPVDKKASTRQRNTGKVTTVLTKSFNPQMKKASNRDRENPPRRRPRRLSVFLLQPQSKKLQHFVKKASSSGEKSFNWHGGKLQSARKASTGIEKSFNR